MYPAPWMIEEFNRKERERENARFEPIPLHAPSWEGVVDHQEDDDLDEQPNAERPRSTVIIIDMNELPEF
jgi:hypothetical protein